MSKDYVEHFHTLETELNESFERMSELFDFHQNEDVDAKVRAAKNIVAKHERERRMWKNQFFAIVNGEKKGPFDVQALRNLMMTGEVNKDTLIWTKGMKTWVKAGKNFLLKGFFKTLPPQPPAPVQPPTQQPAAQVPAVPIQQLQLFQPPNAGAGGAFVEEGLKTIKKMALLVLKGQF